MACDGAWRGEREGEGRRKRIGARARAQVREVGCQNGCGVCVCMRALRVVWYESGMWQNRRPQTSELRRIPQYAAGQRLRGR